MRENCPAQTQTERACWGAASGVGGSPGAENSPQHCEIAPWFLGSHSPWVWLRHNGAESPSRQSREPVPTEPRARPDRAESPSRQSRGPVPTEPRARPDRAEGPSRQSRGPVPTEPRARPDRAEGPSRRRAGQLQPLASQKPQHTR
ncbi:uncharacterized protein LOC134556215 [Prinia subflava]|uniref:uncharacterized protein LOC134556215 n=1 Tax=Prinia subflava TaxID=208062 RepID=UPI002FE34347